MAIDSGPTGPSSETGTDAIRVDKTRYLDPETMARVAFAVDQPDERL
jgi:hypothetical protein